MSDEEGIISIHGKEKLFLKCFDLLSRLCSSLKSLTYSRKLIDLFLSSKQFKQIFDEADVHGKGSLGNEEVYNFVIRFYLFVAQYTFVIARHIPTREDVADIVSRHDANHDGAVDFEEFKLLFLLLCEGVATQLVAQLLFTLLLAPLLSLCLLFFLKHLFVFFPSLLAQFWFIPSFLCNEKIGLLCCVPLCNMLVLPYYLEYIFFIQSLCSPKKVQFVPDMVNFQLLQLSTEYAARGESDEGAEDIVPRSVEKDDSSKKDD